MQEIIQHKVKLVILSKMEINNQKQHAGDNSMQIQGENVTNNYNITNNYGIDELRARAICKEEYALACQNWTKEAVAIANERVNKLEDKLIPKMLEYDKSLKVFSDPDFQFTLRNAQISAASSDKEEDYDILSELLVHRAEHGNQREQKLGISKAIEIVDKVSDEALCGLACFHIVAHLNTDSPILENGLALLNSLSEKMIKDKPLPVTTDWLEHLDLLSAIRLGVDGINSFKKLKDIMPIKLPQYFECGIKKDSEDFQKLNSELISNGLPVNCFIQHPLNAENLILDIPKNLDDAFIFSNQGNMGIRVPLNDQQKNILQNAIDRFKVVDQNSDIMKEKFMEYWNSYTYLHKLQIWWDSLPCQFSITKVGVALANAYAHAIDNRIPCIY